MISRAVRAILRRPMKAALPAAALAAALALGCGSACQDLGDRICACEATSAAKDNCRSALRNELGNTVKPTDAQQAMCQQILDGGKCPDFQAHPDQCRFLNTVEGKQDCGLANPPTSP